MLREQPTTDWHRLYNGVVLHLISTTCTLCSVQLTLANATHQGENWSFWPTTKKENSVYLYVGNVVRGINKFHSDDWPIGGNSGHIVTNESICSLWGKEVFRTWKKTHGCLLLFLSKLIKQGAQQIHQKVDLRSWMWDIRWGVWKLFAFGIILGENCLSLLLPYVSIHNYRPRCF